MPIDIVLVEPEIPQNTGNIVRTCAATRIKLHLIEPLGFSIDDKSLKRAGLDYWNLLEIEVHSNLQQFLDQYSDRKMYYATTKANVYNYTEVAYAAGDMILFGKETKGLPENLLNEKPKNCIRIPMESEARSLNLSNSVAIITYEAMRQLNFPNLK